MFWRGATSTPAFTVWNLIVPTFADTLLANTDCLAERVLCLPTGTAIGGMR